LSQAQVRLTTSALITTVTHNRIAVIAGPVTLCRSFYKSAATALVWSDGGMRRWPSEGPYSNGQRRGKNLTDREAWMPAHPHGLKRAEAKKLGSFSVIDDCRAMPHGIAPN
jgi:hypothetical protein